MNELLERWVPAEMRRKAVEWRPPTETCNFSVAGLDTAYGMEMAGGVEGAYRKILKLYCRDAEPRVEFLNAAQAEKDIINFVTLVHSLNGSSAIIGASALSEDAGRLEMAGRTGDMAFIRERIDRFRENLSGIMERIGAALAEAANRAGNGRDKDVPLLDRADLLYLKKVLKARDIRAIDKLVDKLTGSLTDDALESELSRLADCILISDFDEAEKILDTLLPDV
jgi:HPt (histidine-containing phosphotransfer) domain-containing protein